MINKIIAFFFVHFIFVNSVFSQDISGIVSCDTTKVFGAQVLVKKGTRILANTSTDANGKFVFHNISQDSLEIRVAHLNYEPHSVFLKKTTSEVLKFELVRKVNVLQEVVVKKQLAVSQKKDTVVYNPELFKDGSERVVEDLLKKLPGVTVTDAGKIFFKGKEIQALMLDGDDLFNSRYTIGSKNLEVNAVESVEAIENFNANKVLHKISETDKVAINLKLKKGLPVLTMRSELENGLDSKYNNTATALLLHSQYKGFSSSGVNTIGISDESMVVESDLTRNGKTRDLIVQGNFPQNLGKDNSLLNETFVTNNSLKIKKSKQTALTFGVNYLKDRFFQDTENVTNYRFEDQNFVYENIDHQIKKPEVLSFNNQIEYYNDDDLQISTKMMFEKRQSSFENAASNNSILRKNNVNTDGFFIGGKAVITKMLDKKSALDFSALVSQNKSEQDFLLFPSIEITNSELADRQLSTIATNFFNGQLQYYHNWNKVNLKISNTIESKTDKLDSWLGYENFLVDGFRNDIAFKSFVNQFATQLKFQLGKFKFGLTETLWYNRAKRTADKFDDFQSLFHFDVKYALTKKQSLQFVFFQNIDTPMLENVYQAPILNSYRSVSLNEGKIDNIKKTESALSYTISDFYNTFFFRTTLSYTSKDKDYYFTTQLSPSLVYNKTVLLDQGNTVTSLNLSIHKLIPFLKINLKYNGVCNFSTFYNFIDNSALRSVKNKSLKNELILYKNFGLPFSLNNKMTVDSNFFEADDGQRNKLIEVQNEFKVNYKITKDFILESFIQTFIPNTKKNEFYNFLGFEVMYNLKKFNCEVNLRGHNLFNHKRFSSSFVSDFAVSSYSYRLQERYVLLGFRFKVF
ncbi:carboxypeptidase-like regulatory domain-containing protein [Flavobacterium sp. SM15]|uniref:carboxypeptidase-like regulatory domain-containing protein n=1 Tax=Flavobacterium sp. SM15 TaxID=2908005 RepID=UPI001EDA1881|nr:carboxypeptidase-like regulatory domain-containing protein [Flavobacterium sp. SM15]MCG2610917.1 carboxypeptidase-like regulatory domain-containing protein [Flavobacterium sp. SM15]